MRTPAPRNAGPRCVPLRSSQYLKAGQNRIPLLAAFRPDHEPGTVACCDVVNTASTRETPTVRVEIDLDLLPPTARGISRSKLGHRELGHFQGAPQAQTPTGVRHPGGEQLNGAQRRNRQHRERDDDLQQAEARGEASGPWGPGGSWWSGALLHHDPMRRP